MGSEVKKFVRSSKCEAPVAIRHYNGAAMQVTWVFPGLFVVLWSTGFIGAKLGLPYAILLFSCELRFLFVLAILLPLCWLFRAPWPSPATAPCIWR